MTKFFVSFLLVLGCAVSVKSQLSQPYSEEQYEKYWLTGLNSYHLKAVIPQDYKTVPMKDCNLGNWNCGTVFDRFHRVFMRADGNVAIGIQIFGNHSWVTPKGDTLNTNIDFYKNAEIVFKNYLGNSSKFTHLDKTLLKKNWDAIYGMKLSRNTCNSPYLGFTNNKLLLIANKGLQIIIVYFYQNDFNDKIDAEIDKTIPMVQLNDL